MKIAILGAGLAGLELGRNLKARGKDFIILEKEPRIGGLCRTNKTGEFCWDFAVHAIYSRSKEIMDYFRSLPLEYAHIHRNAKIVHSGSDGRKYILDYPFEIGIKNLPVRDKLECIWGYFAAKSKDTTHYSNLKDLIYQRLGKGIAKHFMTAYNNKIWDCELSEISYKLVSAKIDPFPLVDFLLSILGKNIIGRAYQAKFIYPKAGIQKLIDHTAKDIRDNIVLSAAVKKLVKNGNKWVVITETEAKIEADTIVSTIPLVELLKKIEIDGIRKEYDVFRWNDTFFVMIGLAKGHNFQLIGDCHWAFFKEDEVFYRATLMHNFSPEFAPALVAEITRKGEFLSKTEEEIKNLVIKDLIKREIIGSVEHIVATEVKLLRYTYPIPTVGLDLVKENIRNILEINNIFLLGRGGNWDYINMDEVITNAQQFSNDKFSHN